MLLPPKVAHGVADGSLSLAFRRWRKQVVAVDPGAITDDEVSPRGLAYLARTTRL